MKRLINSALLILTLAAIVAAQSMNAVCPKIEVTGGGMVKPGDSMNFSAELANDAKNFRIEYEWQVSNGKIASGQGTSLIVVDTTGVSNAANVTATVQIKGLPAGCENIASETGSTITEIIGEPVAQYGKLPFNEERSRIDQFLSDLAYNPKDEGLILITLGKNENIEDGKKYIGKIIGHVEFRKFPLDRITFMIEESSWRSTTHLLVPVGAEYPKCEECLVIKAEEF